MTKHFIQLCKSYFFHTRTSLRYFSSSSGMPKSSLFISGERAIDTFVVVVPHLEFDQRFDNLVVLEENIKKRGLNFNLIEMKDSWSFYKDWKEKKIKLEKNYHEAGKQITVLLKTGGSDDKKVDIENIERYRGLLKEELNQVKKNVWNLEDSIIGELLKLPNELHEKVPCDEEILFIFNKECTVSSCDHLEVGERLDCLEYRSEMNCFLKNQAVLFDLALSEVFVDNFMKHGFIRFSNPDFSRNVLAEGVGLAPNDSSHLFLLEQTENHNDNLHLCGGASLFPFCAYHAKHTVPKQFIPLKYITTGRQYKPTTNSLPGLYSLNQETSVQMFLATYSNEEVYNEFQNSVNILQEIFCSLKLNFQVVNEPPLNLKNWESLRVSFRVFSTHYNKFIEVAHISLIGDYISKRLRMCFTDKKEESFLKVVSGTVVNTHILLALCLERSTSNLLIPDVVKLYDYVT